MSNTYNILINQVCDRLEKDGKEDLVENTVK
jgi:hypothetical protein